MKFIVCENNPSVKGGVKVIQDGFDSESAAKDYAGRLNQKWADGAGETLEDYMAKRLGCHDEGYAFVSEDFEAEANEE